VPRLAQKAQLRRCYGEKKAYHPNRGARKWFYDQKTVLLPENGITTRKRYYDQKTVPKTQKMAPRTRKRFLGPRNGRPPKTTLTEARPPPRPPQVPRHYYPV